MAEVVMREWDRPAPEPDHDSAPFFAAAARGQLAVQRCCACGHLQHYPRAICVRCGGTPGWQECSGLGTVHTFTVVRQIGAEPFRSEVPYVLAVVKIEEGVLMTGTVTDCAVEDVHIGLPVEVYMVLAGADVGVPYWRPRRT